MHRANDDMRLPGGEGGSAAPRSRPLSIAMMIETVGLGGAEMVMFQLSEELRERGHTVHPIGFAGKRGWLDQQFRDAGFEWHMCEIRRAVDLGLPRRLANVLRALQIDLAHSHEFAMGVYGTAAMRRLGRPHVITMHGNQHMTDRLRRRVALRWAFARSHATVAVSEATRVDLETALGLAPAVVEVVHNGIPVRSGDGEAVRRELGLDSSQVLLLSVGSLIRRKGHAVLLEALSSLQRDGNGVPWYLAIAGQGEERPRLEALIESLGLTDRVRLLGPRSDVPDLQAGADVFVMPSLWEGLPLAVLEAMFAGNAIVASRTSGIPEAIRDGQHGLLVPPGDSVALAGALKRLLDDPALRSALGEAGEEHARAEFSITAMTDAYERLYQRSLEHL